MDKDKVQKLKKILTKAKNLKDDVFLAKEFVEIDEKIEDVKESVDSISEELKKKLESELVLDIDPEEIRGEKGLQEQKDRDNINRDAEILEVETLIAEAKKLGIK